MAWGRNRLALLALLAGVAMLAAAQLQVNVVAVAEQSVIVRGAREQGNIKDPGGVAGTNSLPCGPTVGGGAFSNTSRLNVLPTSKIALSYELTGPREGDSIRLSQLRGENPDFSQAAAAASALEVQTLQCGTDWDCAENPTRLIPTAWRDRATHAFGIATIQVALTQQKEDGPQSYYQCIDIFIGDTEFLNAASLADAPHRLLLAAALLLALLLV